MEENQESGPVEEKKIEEIKKEEKPRQENRKEEQKPNLASKLKDRLANYQRTIEIAHKPDRDEFISSMKITVTGIVLVGLIGFIIFIVFQIPKLIA